MLSSFTRHFKLRRLAFWVLLPLLFLIIYGVLVEATSRDRFDERYFTAAYIEKYDTPGAVLAAMEEALITRDEAVIAELQGRTDPVVFNYTPNLRRYGLYEVSQGARIFNSSHELSNDEWQTVVDEATFLTYIYYVPDAPGRVNIHVEQVDGRWVLTTLDPYVVWSSGRWVTAFVPLLVIYWLGLVGVVGGVWVYRASMELNEEIFGPSLQAQ
jgi:hypothetical protein